MFVSSSPLRPALTRILLAAWLGVSTSAAWAWSNHPLCTWQALDGMPEIAGRMVAVESFDQFLQMEAARLPQVLAQEELWARQHLPLLPPPAPTPWPFAASAAPRFP